MILIVLSAVLIIAVIVVLVVVKKKGKSEGKSKAKNLLKPASSVSVKESKQSERYINPTDFSVGVIKDVPCTPSDTCGSKVLYPLSNPDVDYGSKMPDGCPCDQFLESP